MSSFYLCCFSRTHITNEPKGIGNGDLQDQVYTIPKDN